MGSSSSFIKFKEYSISFHFHHGTKNAIIFTLRPLLFMHFPSLQALWYTSFCSLGHNMSSSIPLGPYFGIKVNEIITSQPFHHLINFFISLLLSQVCHYMMQLISRLFFFAIVGGHANCHNLISLRTEKSVNIHKFVSNVKHMIEKSWPIRVSCNTHMLYRSQMCM